MPHSPSWPSALEGLVPANPLRLLCLLWQPSPDDPVGPFQSNLDAIYWRVIEDALGPQPKAPTSLTPLDRARLRRALDRNLYRCLLERPVWCVVGAEPSSADLDEDPEWVRATYKHWIVQPKEDAIRSEVKGLEREVGRERARELRDEAFEVFVHRTKNRISRGLFNFLGDAGLAALLRRHFFGKLPEVPGDRIGPKVYLDLLRKETNTNKEITLAEANVEDLRWDEVQDVTPDMFIRDIEKLGDWIANDVPVNKKRLADGVGQLFLALHAALKGAIATDPWSTPPPGLKGKRLLDAHAANETAALAWTAKVQQFAACFGNDTPEGLSAHPVLARVRKEARASASSDHLTPPDLRSWLCAVSIGKTKAYEHADNRLRAAQTFLNFMFDDEFLEPTDHPILALYANLDPNGDA